MAWTRKLWGVEYRGANGERVIIGAIWSDFKGRTFYAGEPSRALVFCTRKRARDWIAARPAHKSNARLRAVRVVETVRKI